MTRAIFRWCIGFFSAVVLLSASAEAVVVNYGYDGAGRLIAADYGFGKRITYVYDLNGNLLRQSTQFNMADAVRIMQMLAGMLASPAISLDGDANADGKINMMEAIYVLQAVSGLRE